MVSAAYVEPLAENDFFTVLQLAEASEQAQRDPATVTDRQLRMIACYDQNAAQTAAKRRVEAHAKARAALLAPPPAVAPAAASRSATRDELDDLYKDALDLGLPDEAFLQKLNKVVAKDVSPSYVLGFLMIAVRKINAANGTRNERIFKLETGQSGQTDSAVIARIAAMEAKIATGFQISGWGWKYESGATYKPGELVQRNGIWCCIRETKTQPGSDPTSWKLLVHRKFVGSDDDQ